MKIDLDTAINVAAAKQGSLKWDLVLTLDGTDYRVRPMTNADVQRLAAFTTITTESEAVGFLDGLFEETKPDIQAMLQDQGKISALILGITLYLEQHLKKKSQLLASAVQGQISLAASMAGS